MEHPYETHRGFDGTLQTLPHSLGALGDEFRNGRLAEDPLQPCLFGRFLFRRERRFIFGVTAAHG